MTGHITDSENWATSGAQRASYTKIRNSFRSPKIVMFTPLRLRLPRPPLPLPSFSNFSLPGFFCLRLRLFLFASLGQLTDGFIELTGSILFYLFLS